MECDCINMVSSVFICVVVVVIQISGQVNAAGTCTFQQGSTSVVAYCESGCCDTACCSSSTDSGVDTTLILIILGAVVAVVLVILIIVAVVCCLKDRKKDRQIQKDVEIIQLTESPASGASSQDSSERPRLHREKAMLVVDKAHRKSSSHSEGGDASPKSKYSSTRQKRPDYKRESAFFQNEVTPSPPVKTVSGIVSSRASKSRQRSDSILPQVIEVREPDDVEAEESV